MKPFSGKHGNLFSDFLSCTEVVALKRNHPNLYNHVKDWFETAKSQEFMGIEMSYDCRTEKGHHRVQNRQVWAVSVAQLGGLYKQEQWAGLRTIVIVERVRHLWNKTTREVQLYLSSLPVDAKAEWSCYSPTLGH